MERQIEEKYVKTGAVRFGFQHFPFLGDESQWAAEANECAHEQGKFWEYHDLLYARQNGENRGAFSRDHLKQFALDLKLDATKFNPCFDGGKVTSLVRNEVAYAQSLGVRNTPSFLINGRAAVGALPFESFQQMIEAEKK